MSGTGADPIIITHAFNEAEKAMEFLELINLQEMPADKIQHYLNSATVQLGKAMNILHKHKTQ